MSRWMRMLSLVFFISLGGANQCLIAQVPGDQVPGVQFSGVQGINAPALQLVFESGHELEGLPKSADAMPLYDDNSESIANRLHRILFIETLVPEEIVAALPSERRKAGVSDAEFFTPGWYFRKREGQQDDRLAFGGDVRVSPRRSFSQEERTQFLELLAETSSAERSDSTPFSQSPLMRLMLQWNLLSVRWSLERAKRDDTELLEAFAVSIVTLAQPESTLRDLPSGLDALWAGHAAKEPESTPPVSSRKFSGVATRRLAVDRGGAKKFTVILSRLVAACFANVSERGQQRAFGSSARRRGQA